MCCLMPRNITQHAVIALYNRRDLCIFNTEFFKEPLSKEKTMEEEKHAVEIRLRRAQKMEAIGLMAGGVAHDLNNILSGIVTYPELLLMELPEESPLRRPIKTMQESGMRAVDVVADLMTIVRGVATGRETLKLNTVVEEYLSSAEHEKLKTMHSFITFKTDLDSDLLNISGSPTHIEKTLMNLVINASEAIEGRGTVTISSTTRYLDEPFRGYENIRQGEYAVLSVSDQGPAYLREILRRFLNPLYQEGHGPKWHWSGACDCLEHGSRPQGIYKREEQ